METMYMISNKNGDDITTWLNETCQVLDLISTNTGFIPREMDRLKLHLNDCIRIDNSGINCLDVLGFTLRDELLVHKVVIDCRNSELLSIELHVGRE